MLQAASSSRDRRSSGWPNLSSLLRRQLVVLLIGTVYHVPLSFCQNYSPSDLAKVTAACRQCDDSALYSITQYQNNFLGAIGVDQSVNLTSLDIGRQYCAKFSKLFACYQDCLQGYKVTYTSYMKTSFVNFNNQFCDPDCLLTFLPGCYAEAGVPYDLYRSGCDPNEPALRSSISKCINYWFDQQKCQGVCTKGQRAASGLKLSLEVACGVPELNYECGAALTQCMELSYGGYGADFIARDSLLNGIGSGSCSAYGKTFSSCLHQAVNGVVTFGNPPFTVNYDQPCADFVDLVSQLTSLSDSAVKPLCDNPQLNLSTICSPTFSAVTIATDSSTTSTRASSSTADLQTLSTVAYRQSTDSATTSVSFSSNDTPKSPSTANPATTRQSETASPAAPTEVNNPATDFAKSSSPATSTIVATPALSTGAPPATKTTSETYYTTIVDIETTAGSPRTNTTTFGTPSTAETVATPTASYASPVVGGGTTAAGTASATLADDKSTIAETTLAINVSPTTVGGLPVVSSQISDTGVTRAPASGTGDGITPVTKAPSTKKPCKKRKP